MVMVGEYIPVYTIFGNTRRQGWCIAASIIWEEDSAYKDVFYM